MGGMEDADPRRRLRMLGYWSVSHRNILGMPNRAVGEMVDGECGDDNGEIGDD